MKMRLWEIAVLSFFFNLGKTVYGSGSEAVYLNEKFS